MELHSMHKAFHHSHHLGEEKHQMLNLNRRLETYLSQVKLLEEENALLAKEIQTMRGNHRGALTRRKGLEEELQQVRLEVDAAWRDRVHTELEVDRLTEELQALDLKRQREARAQVEAKMKLEQSRKELEEEQRAQMWLRGKVWQLEEEMRHLIQTHQEDVAHLEASLAQSRATMPPTLAQRGNQIPDLHLLGQEYSQRAARAWQEAAETYQGQLARLEESVNQARSRLTLVSQEKSESQLKLQALQKEIASAHDVRQHLEKAAAQQEDKCRQEIQKLQEHLEGLEAEKEELGQQTERLILENRGLLQVKMSLGLEVATYRTLLDGESLRGDISLFKQPRNSSITDAVFSPRGVKKNYQAQLSACHKTTSLSYVRGITERGPTATPIWSRKPVTLNETPKICTKPAYDDTKKSVTPETPYPKILQDGAIENFRPQEVQETVTYAEPLSPPNEQEAPGKEVEKESEEEWSTVGVERPEKMPEVESAVSYEVGSDFSIAPAFTDEVGQYQFTPPTLNPYSVGMAVVPCGFSDEPDKDVPFEKPAEKEDVQEPQEPQTPMQTWVEKEHFLKDEEPMQEETSDSETEAVLEPNFESRTSSPVSECEHEDSVFNKVTDFSQNENLLKEDAEGIREETSCSEVGAGEVGDEDKLYPDGEEMDTWDSVIERKVDIKTDDDAIKNDEEKRQHAEPEEDISVREQEHEKTEIRQDFPREVDQDDILVSSMMETPVDVDEQHVLLDQEQAPLLDNEDNEDEDSQNVSVSWRTELESDSYAQDNTLADTRPLIRYKSDETDANTQASHMDESESSEGEQEKKVGETGSGTWSDGKSKRFGTMEDLCEEGEGEALDGEYDLGYTHVEDRDVGHGMTGGEQATLEKDAQNEEEINRKVSEGHSDVETEELTKPAVPTSVDDDEELEIDKLVEEELENLATESYSTHFSQQQVRESEKMLHLQCKSSEEMSEQDEPGKTKTDDLSSYTEPDVRVNHELGASCTITEQPHENLHFGEMSVVMPEMDTLAAEEALPEAQEAVDGQGKKEGEDEHGLSMVTHPDVTEDLFGFGDRPDVEEISSQEPTAVLQVTADQENLQDVAIPTEVKEAVPVEASSLPEKHLIHDVEDCQEYPEVPETAEWEVLEAPSEDFDIRDHNKDLDKCDIVPESAESDLHDDGGSDEGVMTHKEEPLESSPDSVPDENDIFVVKDSTELLNTNGKDNSLHAFFSSGVKKDFWVSSFETGATYQPDDACNEAAEQTNQNEGFDNNLVWGNPENPNVVNRNSRVDIDSPKSLASKNEQHQHLEVKQVLKRNIVEGELVHSEESEAEGESWSSGEEPV